MHVYLMQWLTPYKHVFAHHTFWNKSWWSSHRRDNSYRRVWMANPFQWQVTHTNAKYKFTINSHQGNIHHHTCTPMNHAYCSERLTYHRMPYSLSADAVVYPVGLPTPTLWRWKYIPICTTDRHTTNCTLAPKQMCQNTFFF